MDQLLILAQASTKAAEAAAEAHPIVPLDYIWQQATALSWLQAVIGISFGTVYLFYGWRIFKILVVICFALIGLFAGIKLGGRFNEELWGGIIGLFALAAVSIPLMRWAVSGLGAVAGGILAGGIWYAIGLPEKYILAGAIIGMVAGGMISFIVFRIAVMLFSSLGGSILVMTGLLSLIYQYENLQAPPTAYLHEWFYTCNWFIPVLLIVPTAIGIIVQNKLIKTSSGWSL